MGFQCGTIKLPWLLLSGLILTSSTVRADVGENGGLLSRAGAWNPNQSDSFRDWDLHLGGWLNAGFSINPDQPADNFNGAVSFSDRANELQINQLYLYLQRAADTRSDSWGWGGRLDFIFGSDAFYTRSMGDIGDHWDSHLLHQRIYGIAFPQAYLDIFAPIGAGLHVKLGEFYTLVGNESVIAPDNFFYSRSYAMQFGEPFSHTGLVASYALNHQIELSAGAVTGSPFAGWDGSFEHHLENWGFVGGLNFAFAQTGTKLAVTGTHGRSSSASPQDVNLYSIVVKQNLSGHWQFTLQHDYGWMTANTAQTGAEWYAVVAYLNLDLNPEWSLGLRLEWFRDDDGVRVGSPARLPTHPGHAANYYAATWGANWRPTPWLTVRPSVRYDASDGWQAFNSNASDRQLLISSDIVLNF
ncbi:MAG: porin [Methylomonas sp.]|jgi:hypothetical protein|uniref:porin n=1 Tax=Methylomonas sp. TaxID=418 RepID=UPI0025FC1274|nr:porin [Methylomonas sp.]MCK9609147.1 porin [Methylomonas sp.]